MTGVGGWRLQETERGQGQWFRCARPSQVKTISKGERQFTATKRESRREMNRAKGSRIGTSDKVTDADDGALHESSRRSLCTKRGP